MTYLSRPWIRHEVGMLYYQLHIYGAGCWAQALLVIISRNDSETCDELAAQKSEA